MRSLRSLAASGLSNLPDNPTPPPDDGGGEGRKKTLGYAGYCDHRRVCRVL